MKRTETVNGDLFRRLESRIKALEQAVTLLSKIAKVDVSKLLQSGVDDDNSSSSNNGLGIGGNTTSSTVSSSVLPSSEAISSGKAPPRQFSVRKLRIKIRSLEGGGGNKFLTSSTPTPVPLPPPIQPQDQEVQLETNKIASPHVQQANEEDDPDWIPEPLSPGSDNASEADEQPSENDPEDDKNGTEVKSTSASTSTSSPKSKDDPDTKPLGYECEKCFTTGFKTRHALKRHKRAEHPVHDRIGNGQGWRTCPYCDKKVYAACKFENHLRTHTGERPYLCSQCGFAAKSKETLNSHVKHLHDGSLPTLVCKYCGKEFKGKSNLTLHEKSHEDHGKTCTICNRKYVNLKGHIQTVHERIRKWECHLCDFKFLKKCNLDKHVKNHDNPNRRVKGYHIVRPERLLNRGKKTVLRIFQEEEKPKKIQEETPQEIGNKDEIV